MLKSISDFSSALNDGRLSALDVLAYRYKNGIQFRFHPLGFVACTLLSNESTKVRLHCWPSSGGRQQSTACQIHDHAFDFQSWVLAGSIENLEYKISPIGLDYARYNTEYIEDSSVLIKHSDRIRLAPATSKTYSAGDNYLANAGVLHETRRVGSGPALTVLITRDTSIKAPTVLGPIDGDFSYAYRREIVPECELDLMLNGI